MIEFNVITGILGGLGLFLFGIHLLSNALRALSLGFLKNLIEKVTSNRVKSALVGVFVTSVIQSSSATSVILIGFLNAGIISLAAALPVIFGANIGTTITAQLIAFKLTKSALLFVFVGAMIYLFAKKTKNKDKGKALLGFGILFFGMATMGSAVVPLTHNEAIIGMFLQFSKMPVLGILTGILVTIILQSSSTTIGLVIAFASAGLLNLEASVYLVLGDNIGTCITAVLASIGGKLASKRLALGHVLFNVVGTLIVFPFIPLYLNYMPLLSSDIARQIANTHTLFNLINTLILLPFIPLFLTVLMKVFPGEDYEKRDARYLDKNLLVTPNLAIRAIIQELSAMLTICQDMLAKAKQCTISYNHKIKNEIHLDEESVDEMQRNITNYLVELIQTELTEKQRRLIPALVHTVNDIERVGDYCEGIVRHAQRTYENNLVFSPEAKEELEKLLEKTATIMRLTKKAIENNDQQAAKITLTIEREIDEHIIQYKMNHLYRLEHGSCIGESGLVFSDILTDLERLNDHLCNITKGILHLGKR
jgi:phosphate:Na+ symporter